MTTDIFREDSYLASLPAIVTSIDSSGALVLDKTVFYPSGGGQPGDVGNFIREDGSVASIGNTVYAADGQTILHVLGEKAAPFRPGERIQAQIDWGRRFKLMRAHTGLHLLCAIVPFPVTGGQIGEAQGRLDFDMPDGAPDRDELTEKLNALIEANHKVSHRYISEEQLDQNPQLVRTMKVQPPRGRGRVRLVEIKGVDLQPCGGTHVATTGEIRRAMVTKIEKKGEKNRRIRVEFAE